MCLDFELPVGNYEHFSVTFEVEREEHSLLCKYQTYELKAFYLDQRDFFFLNLIQENSFATLHWWLPKNKRSLRLIEKEIAAMYSNRKEKLFYCYLTQLQNTKDIPKNGHRL